MQEPNSQPPGARAINTDELLACIGELYIQVRVMRQLIAQQQQQASERAPNGTLQHQAPPSTYQADAL